METITASQFTEMFQIRRSGTMFECYGKMNGVDLFEVAKTWEDAKIEMWNRLDKAGWVKHDK